MTIHRYGQPGGNCFAYLCDLHGKEVIIYAPTMVDALAIYRHQVRPHEPWSIRQMADNE